MRAFLSELVWPTRCACCRQFGEWICSECIARLKSNREWRCGDCHRPSAFGAYCPECRRYHALDGLWVAVSYKNKEISALIKAFKYKGLEQTAWVLCRQLKAYWRRNRELRLSGLEPEWQELLDLIMPLPLILSAPRLTLVPVPLHPWRWRWRGFNQSRRLAAALAGGWPELEIDNSLARVRFRRPQARLNKKQRERNLKNAFAWTGPDLQGQIIVLVDDVASTGTTLKECAKELKKHGAETVWGLVLAQG